MIGKFAKICKMTSWCVGHNIRVNLKKNFCFQKIFIRVVLMETCQIENSVHPSGHISWKLSAKRRVEILLWNFKCALVTRIQNYMLQQTRLIYDR